MKRARPVPGLRIREDTFFEPGTWTFERGEGIVIEADGIVVDGTGAVLEARAPAPEIPDGDFLYSPGSLGLAREIHELLARRIPIAGSGDLALEYRYWGRGADPAAVAISPDRKQWRPVAGAPAAGPGWVTRGFAIGAWPGGDLSLRFSVPGDALSPEGPVFYDGFRLLKDGAVVWEGDARAHWDAWYNTGFTIFKRAARRFFAGTAIRAEGRRGVTLRNVTARGFLAGISLTGCTGWTLEGNDLSDNFDDPDYGWGEGSERFAGLYLDRVTRSTIRRNRGRQVWNGIVLRRCDDNTIERNDFSHCSNTCLKMAQSSRNIVRDNVLSWGLRIYPQEVHARDSVSLLVESGSNDNTFLRNDFTHGGDGIFIRVLDHWCSTGNLFEANDCSHANNNAVESWSPGNRYVRNKANGSSYGFWLGGSDDTVLRDNEVMHNGKAFRNAPEPFGNAGVSVVHGASTGFIVTGNRIVDNAGPGVSIGYKAGSPAKLWLIAGNEIRNNRDDPRGYEGKGIFLEHCEDVILGRNAIEGNEGRSVVVGENCAHVTRDSRIARILEGLVIRAGAPITAGAPAELSLAGVPAARPSGPGSSLRLEWDFGDGSRLVGRQPAASHTWSRPGRYRVSVAVFERGACGIATRSVFVQPRGAAVVDFARTESWKLESPGSADRSLEAVKEGAPGGGAFLRATVRSGTRSVLSGPLSGPVDLSRAAGFSFWYRYSCDLSILSGKRTRTVGLRLLSGAGSLELVPDEAFKGEPSEDRYDWVYFAAPSGSLRAGGQPELRSATGVELVFGPDATADCIFCAGGLVAWEELA